jgi:hypothetical protein
MLQKQPIQGRSATPPASLSMPSVSVRATLPRRAHGNLIDSDAPGLTSAASDVIALGGATRQFLGRGQESLSGPADLGGPVADLGRPVIVNERDRAEHDLCAVVRVGIADVPADRRTNGMPSMTRSSRTCRWSPLAQ